MNIIQTIKDIIFPRYVLFDPYGEYVEKKVERILKESNERKKADAVNKTKVKDVQKLLKEDPNVIEPDKNKLKNRGDVITPGPITKEKCKMNYKETGYWTTTVDPGKYEQELTFNELKTAEAIEPQVNAQGLSTKEFIERETNIADNDTWEDVREDQYEMVDLIVKLQTENIDLKHAVEYYEKYVKWLEDNYIFILRSPKSLKEDFDKLIGDKNNE